MNESRPFEGRYFDTLQQIERAILRCYQDHPQLLDYQVEKALKAIQRGISQPQRRTKPPRSAGEAALHQRLQAVTRDCLGSAPPAQPLTPAEMRACYKRIHRSLRQMNGRGRQAYLNFLTQHLGR